MALQGITVLTLLGIVQIAVGQQSLFSWQGNQNQAPAPLARDVRGFPFGGGIFGGDPFFNDRNDFWGDFEEPTVYTCIGKNTNMDELRVTFRNEPSRNRWDRWLPQRVQMEARVSVSGQSQTRGSFQLIATEYGRVEDGCVIGALGDIIGSDSWFRRRPNTEIGILGREFPLAPRQGHTSTTYIRGFASAEALNGHGLALCLRRQISGGTCNGIIPLCCKIGRDSKSATELNRPNFGFGINGSPNNLFASSSGIQGGVPGALPGASPAGIPGGMTGGVPGGIPGASGTGGLPGGTGNTGGAAPQFQALFGGA
ncbi:uncharacterized protein [Haliotis asinina]|uniref:uncharacterized protein n=1 Tax=Haliotis asinina TaxID=109174 RepID=UPI00353205AF